MDLLLFCCRNLPKKALQASRYNVVTVATKMDFYFSMKMANFAEKNNTQSKGSTDLWK